MTKAYNIFSVQVKRSSSTKVKTVRYFHRDSLDVNYNFFDGSPEIKLLTHSNSQMMFIKDLYNIRHLSLCIMNNIRTDRNRSFKSLMSSDI